MNEGNEKYQAYFPDISAKALQEGREEEDFRKRLETAMKNCAEEHRREVVLQVEFENRRMDLWQQLWINEAAFSAGRITDAEYFLWLVKYLAVRKKYYLDRCPIIDDEEALLKELGRLAVIGLRGKEKVPASRKPREEQTEEERKEVRRARRLEKHLAAWEARIRAKKEMRGILRSLLGDSLKILAKEMEDEKAEGETRIVDRLRKTKCLPRLWEILERTAMHTKIENWFQDSGFPLYKEKDEDEDLILDMEDEEKKKKKKTRKYPPLKGDRKQDFTMRLFAAFCDSEYGYDFVRKDQSSVALGEDWLTHPCSGMGDGMRAQRECRLLSREH